MKIRHAPQARADLDEIFAYLDERSPAAARSVKARIISAIRRLADHPAMAPETDESAVRELTIVRYPLQGLLSDRRRRDLGRPYPTHLAPTVVGRTHMHDFLRLGVA